MELVLGAERIFGEQPGEIEVAAANVVALRSLRRAQLLLGPSGEIIPVTLVHTLSLAERCDSAMNETRTRVSPPRFRDDAKRIPG